MDIEETTFDKVDEVYADWQTKFKLWNGMKVWNELS
jgi:hypothetical protein